jgi:hypothetical protein
MPRPSSSLTPPDVGGIDQSGACRIQLRHKNIPPASIRRLESPRCNIVVGGVSVSRHIGVAAPIHRYGKAIITTTPPDVGGIDQSGACRIQLRHKNIPPASLRRLESPRCNIVVGGVKCIPSHRRCRSHPPLWHSPSSEFTPPDVGGIDQSGACRIQLRHKNIPLGEETWWISSSGKPPVSHRSRWRKSIPSHRRWPLPSTAMP